MPRKTMRMSEIRALANRYLAGSDPELVELRRGVASMYEHLAMAANDYHGYNDLVQVWAGEPGKSAYVPDEIHRRAYHGEMSGPDAQAAQGAIDHYREQSADTDAELARRRMVARNIKLDTVASEIAGSITDSARLSGDDPIAWVTGNSYMPPLRSFPAAETVWQSDGNGDGEDFAYLTELVEAKLSEAGVALECPEYDNALYAVDLRRFEFSEDPEGETLQGDWRPIKDEHPTEVPEGIAPAKPVDQELYDRTAPAWTCVSDPGKGPHYIPHAICLWCGKTAAQIRDQAGTGCCEECEGDHA